MIETTCKLACVFFFIGGCQRESQPDHASRVIAEDKDRGTQVAWHVAVRQLEGLGEDQIEPLGLVNELQTGDYDEKLQDLSSAHVPYMPDALALLRQAMTKALQDNKCVLMQMGGPGCAPCKQLSLYLSDHADTISRDYVYLTLDTRMTSVDKVWQQYWPRPSSIPWMVVVSPTGEVLATSERDGFNIGYPSSRASKNHFRHMLASTARRLSSDEIDSIVRGLGVD